MAGGGCAPTCSRPTARATALLTCECCLATATLQWHVDHVRPRSTHPALALEPANLQVLCQDCNLGKGTRYATDWRQEPA